MRRSLARYSAPVSSVQAPFWADFITNIVGFRVFGTHNRVLSFKPQLRLEWRGQDGQHETEQPDHSASLGDSITASTRIRFSVHTGLQTSQNSNQQIGLHPPNLSIGLLEAIKRFGARRSLAGVSRGLPSAHTPMAGNEIAVDYYRTTGRTPDVPYPQGAFGRV